MRDEPGLVVLHLVLRDHSEREAGVREVGAESDGLAVRQVHPLDEVEHPAANLVTVTARLTRRQQRQRGPLGARVLERVVQRIDLRVHRVAAADRAKQPQFLLVGDVGEIPHQR